MILISFNKMILFEKMTPQGDATSQFDLSVNIEQPVREKCIDSENKNPQLQITRGTYSSMIKPSSNG